MFGEVDKGNGAVFVEQCIDFRCGFMYNINIPDGEINTWRQCDMCRQSVWQAILALLQNGCGGCC